MTSGRGEFDRSSQLARLIRAQYGQVTRAQLRSADFTARRIDYLLRQGRLTRRFPGVYAVGWQVDSPSADLVAAILACGPGAVVSHRSAGYLWGLCERPGATSVICSHRGTKSPPGIEVHRVRALRPHEQVVFDRIPVTTVARTLLDISSSVAWDHTVGGDSDDEIESLIEAASRSGKLRPKEVRKVLRGSGRRRGADRLRRVFESWDPERRPTRSEFERMMRRDLERVGAAPTDTNIVLNGYEVDMLWREHRLMVELDGARHHSGDASFNSDRGRDFDFNFEGYRVLRVSWAMYRRNPSEVVARIVSILRDQEEIMAAVRVAGRFRSD